MKAILHYTTIFGTVHHKYIDVPDNLSQDEQDKFCLNYLKNENLKTLRIEYVIREKNFIWEE